MMAFAIAAYAPEREAALVALSLRAWAPVFAGMEPAVPAYVHGASTPTAGRRGRRPTFERWPVACYFLEL